jgi:glycosyltransferase involved in cell wall biosynthesis
MFLYARADRLQAISHAVAEEITHQSPLLSPKIVTIGYPIPDVYFSSDSNSPRKKVILYVGRVAREKGIHLLIDSFVSMLNRCDPIIGQEWKLKIVGPYEVTQGGDGAEYLGDLVRRAESIGSACEFAGPVFDEEALVREYQAASVFVYPSLADKGEAFGLAPLEAMAAGCAVIVSNLRCFDDYIESGENGLKFDHRSSDAVSKLSSLLAGLVENSRSIERLAKNGRKTARRFQTPTIARKMLNDFELVIKDTDIRK